MKVEDVLSKLSKSKFRNSFKLKDKEIEYINKKGLDVIEEHCYKFIKDRLSNKIILNDGKQTPMKGHPVFIAQHSTATCCRGCLYKWHNIPQNKELTLNEQKYIVSVIMTWIKKNME
ncbi:MAG: DUF4186 domain-containing protein [Bacilli bacterium]|nr:DUF4186 domain-containing protein [Bacilli bacterium]